MCGAAATSIDQRRRAELEIGDISRVLGLREEVFGSPSSLLLQRIEAHRG